MTIYKHISNTRVIGTTSATSTISITSTSMYWHYTNTIPNTPSHLPQLFRLMMLLSVNVSVTSYLQAATYHLRLATDCPLPAIYYYYYYYYFYYHILTLLAVMLD